MSALVVMAGFVLIGYLATLVFKYFVLRGKKDEKVNGPSN